MENEAKGDKAGRDEEEEKKNVNEPGITVCSFNLSTQLAEAGRSL